ncbi:MAG: phytanoyl-CoA dioxygenase family protein [Acidobacteria bacterium]|nr:phytanoyl-CoA dioxygenase family protein [Acidobacteriota bacterium]
MRLTDADCKAYEERGYLLIPGAFSSAEIEAMKRELPALLADDSPRRVLEKDQQTVRALHGCHEINEVFGRLARHPRVAGPAQQILGSEVYVHQFKINIKAAFAGDVWKWHQDFIFWLKQDGMREPRAVNAFVFLDDVTEFNGPLFIVPGTHRLGVIDVPDGNPPGAQDAWRASFAADLKYSIAKDALADLVNRHGLVSPKGPAGTVMFTHCNVVHGSPPNMSPFDRTLAIVTYNSVENALLPVADPRPEFLVCRDATPLTLVADDALQDSAAGRSLQAV